MLGNVNTSSALAAFEKMEEKGSLFGYLSASLMHMPIMSLVLQSKESCLSSAGI